MYYIYKIENLVNHKKYIGLTNNIARRRSRHFTDLKYQHHSNSFLQKEYNIYGKDKFFFNIEFEGNITAQEIGEKEKEYIKYYDSYKNGYNQNEGGNFGPSNGGTQLTQSDIYNILAALEFMSRPGQILADIYEVSRTTISRIKRGINHCQYKEEYEQFSKKEREDIYKIFCESANLYDKKVHTTILQGKRKLTQEQVFLILLNEELNRPKSLSYLEKKFNVTNNTFYTILNGQSYKDFALDYLKLDQEQKKKLASLL